MAAGSKRPLLGGAATDAMRKDRSFADEQNRPEALPGDRRAETNASRYRLLRFCSKRIGANSFEPKGPRKSRPCRPRAAQVAKCEHAYDATLRLPLRDPHSAG